MNFRTQFCPFFYTVSYSELPSNLDTDGNGIFDAWELQYFGFHLGNEKYEDTDNDGFSNYIESIAGTNPKDSGNKPASESTINYEYDSVGRIIKISRNVQ